MNRFLSMALILMATLLNSCDKKDTVPGDTFSAIIDGKKFDARYIFLNRDTSANCITIHASGVNLLDKTLTREKLVKDPDYKFFEISFSHDCLRERTFTWDEISAETSCTGFLYMFTDTAGHPEIKGFSSQMMDTGGTLEIEYLDNREGGSIMGHFDVYGMNYNEIMFTDTLFIRHGTFECHFRW